MNRRFAADCMPMATPIGTGHDWRVRVGQLRSSMLVRGSLTFQGFGPDKVGRPQPAYVMIVCP